MSGDPESFLVRWSRRKRAAEREAARPAEGAATELPAAPSVTVGNNAAAASGPARASALAGDPAAAAEASLPPIESLDGLRSDYQAFFQQPVDEGLRRAALKKLFADPHFNQMDMLDVYVDDYTQFEPLPAELRLRLPSARDFLTDSERAELEAAEAPTAAAGDTAESPVGTASGEVEPPASIETGDEQPGLTADETGTASIPPGNPKATDPTST